MEILAVSRSRRCLAGVDRSLEWVQRELCRRKSLAIVYRLRIPITSLDRNKGLLHSPALGECAKSGLCLGYPRPKPKLDRAVSKCSASGVVGCLDLWKSCFCPSTHTAMMPLCAHHRRSSCVNHASVPPYLVHGRHGRRHATWADRRLPRTKDHQDHNAGSRRHDVRPRRSPIEPMFKTDQAHRAASCSQNLAVPQCRTCRIFLVSGTGQANFSILKISTTEGHRDTCPIPPSQPHILSLCS
jgi:hypothetical protein